MRFIILLSVLLYVESIPVSDVDSQWDSQWQQFKVNFDRHYSTAEEEEYRKSNFIKKLEFIEEHNKLYEKGLVSHEVAVNQFSDWASEEYEAYLFPTPAINLPSSVPHPVVAELDAGLFASLPDSYDWRTQNGVTPVKNQGQCGSCWAFAAVSIVEAHTLIHHKQNTSLSEQQLVDCNTQNGGCNGGWMQYALGYAQQSGLETEAQYPYKEKGGTCQNDATKSHLKITGYKELPNQPSDDQIKTAIMTYGPVAVNIDASGDDFGHYKSGILSTGGKDLNHYVTAVGWGPGYWIVKNSWGTSWGQQGYAQMATGVNIRGFNNFIFYPTV